MASLRSVAGRVRRRIQMNPANRERTLFDLFFSGQHQRAIELYQANTPELWNDEAHHMAFASMVALDLDYSDVIERIPPPLTREEFLVVLRGQIQDEESHPSLGLLVQPKHLHKSLFAAALGLGAGKRFFVETGTYTGQSLCKISGLFDALWTVEASPFLNEAASQLFSSKGLDNVTTFLGDSRKFLMGLEPGLGDNAVFFLDAHYSTGITSKDYGACPLIEEIATVLDSSPKALIVVDDLRTMTGSNGYPTLDAVLNSLPHTLDVQVAFDQLIIGQSRTGALLNALDGDAIN